MGPEAGILLQYLILKETPAKKDQDHIEVVTYTNPHVPDRTVSLREDGGDSYLKAVIDSLKLLENAEVDVIIIACNTAHARLPEIQRSLRTPLINIVELAKNEVLAAEKPVGILATDGTVNSGLFSIKDRPEKTVTPAKDLQPVVMNVIHDIKSGLKDNTIADRLEKVIDNMKGSGCEKFVLGCTELSIHHDELQDRLGDIFIDPMRLAAGEAVQLALR